MSERKKVDVEDAAIDFSDLNTFYAIIAICEGGCFHADADVEVRNIINIAKQGAQKCLVRYDKKVADLQRRAK